MANPLTSISPIDGRYEILTKPLQDFFSEAALMKYRCLVEIEYFIALSAEPRIKELPSFSLKTTKKLRNIVEHFSLSGARHIKNIEKSTQHDVKAIEYFLKEKMEKLPCGAYSHFLHFALTSEDISNIAYTLMWRDAIEHAYIPQIKLLHATLAEQTRQWSSIPMLSFTHGQSASPTTIGKEIAVYAARMAKPLCDLKEHTYTAKLNGATGTWAAHTLAYPDVDWASFSKKFIQNFSLAHNPLTTQVEGSDSLAESFLILSRINTILIDLARDMWLYCMRNIFTLKRVRTEVGSSTMPHKINPIHFENAEGNLALANTLLYHLAPTLPVSRMQRDLTGSTVIRNIGVPLAHSLIACKNIGIGLGRIVPNQEASAQELDNHWEVLAEALQILMRKQGEGGAYEKIKALTRGVAVTKDTFKTIIQQLPLSVMEKRKLKRLAPASYIGLAKNLPKLIRMRCKT